MEGLSPALSLILEVEMSMASGENLRRAVVRFTESSSDEFAHEVRFWLLHLEPSLSVGRQIQRTGTELVKRIRSPQRRALLLLLERGLRGESIRGPLGELKKEIEFAAEVEVDHFISTLPFRMLLPLLLLQFPSLLFVLLGPLTHEFLNLVSGGL